MTDEAVMELSATVRMGLPSPTMLLRLVAGAFGAAMLSGIAGFGGGILLLLLCVATVGMRNAIVVVTIAQLASNGGRAWFNRAKIDRRLVGIFSFGSVPGAVAGALLLTVTPEDSLARAIGGLLLLLVVWRRLYPAALRLPEPLFAVMGALSGVGSGLLGTLGPVVSQFFIARGLVRGAYIGTDAAATLVMHVIKTVVYAAVALLTPASAAVGAVLVLPSLAGSWAGKKIVDRMPTHVFIIVVEVALVAAGMTLLVRGS